MENNPFILGRHLTPLFLVHQKRKMLLRTLIQIYQPRSPI